MKQKKLKRLLPPMLAAVLLFSACGGATSGERAQTTSAWNETEVTGMTTERTEPIKPSTEPSAEPATKPATKPSAEPEDGEGFAWPDETALEQMPRLDSIPDPFLRPDGTRAETPEAFEAHRAYLRAALEHYVYGELPEKAETIEAVSATEAEILEGKAVQRCETLLIDGRHRVEIRFTYPKDAAGVPLIMRLDYLCDDIYRPAVEDEALLAGRYAFCTISRRDIAPDSAYDRSTLPYGEDGPGAVAMWAYAAMTTLDYLWDSPVIDQERVALTGHSRDGKAALCAAALDERFTAVIANGSGCGGAGSFYTRGDGCESLNTMLGAFPHWLSKTMLDLPRTLRRNVPVDMIFARALIAPRHVLLTEAEEDKWANPYGAYVNTVLAREICAFLGHEETVNGMTIRPGSHDQLDQDWRYLIEFLDCVFYGVEPQTDFNAEHFDTSKLELGWSVPARG